MDKVENKTKITNGGIDETAYWMTGCRAAMPKLSKDIYAKYWLNDPSREKHNRYIEEVSPTEDIVLSLRNRFFLEEVSAFLIENPAAVFVNLGAGFSSYPLLMPEYVKYCEVDCAEVIETKKQKVSAFFKQGLFPKREITYFAADLNSQIGLEQLSDSLSFWVNGRKSFILAEGLLYYLNSQKVDDLFSAVRHMQIPGSRLGLVTWSPETKSLPVYKRFEDFIRRNIGDSMAQFSFHDPKDIRNTKGYKTVMQTGYFELSKRFQVEPPLQKDDDVFWEDLTIIEQSALLHE